MPAPTITIGQMRHYITIQRPSETQGGDGTRLVYLGYSDTSNIFKNNIFQRYGSGSYNPMYQWSPSGAFAFNGNLWNPTTDSNWHYNNADLSWAQWRGAPYSQDATAVTSDPLFTNPSSRDFTLQAGSPAIDAGINLTTVTSVSGTGTAIVVDDSYYFSDGLGIPGQSGDSIRIGADQVTITGVDNDTKTITFTPSITWVQGEGVNYAFSGTAPDMGAYEYGGIPTITVAVPSSAITYTTAATINVSGTSTDDAAVTSITCVIDTGSCPTPSGTTSWSIANVPLSSGTNVLTVTSHDADTNTASAVRTVIRDNTNPSITITIPATNPYASSLAATTFSGAFDDNIGVDHVTWTNSVGGSGLATIDLEAKTFTYDVPLYVGTQTITMTAYDVAGNSASDDNVVTYALPTGDNPNVSSGIRLRIKL